MQIPVCQRQSCLQKTLCFCNNLQKRCCFATTCLHFADHIACCMAQNHCQKPSDCLQNRSYTAFASLHIRLRQKVHCFVGCCNQCLLSGNSCPFVCNVCLKSNTYQKPPFLVCKNKRHCCILCQNARFCFTMPIFCFIMPVY